LKFIHTSDWHLGRIFYGIHLTHDQSHVLDQLIQLIKDEKPDFLIIAGDLYDRAVPPPEAVELLDDVLTRIIIGLHVPVLIIAGNHDNPRRLGFCSRLLKSHGLHLRCSLDTWTDPVVFHDKDGPVSIYTIPYAEPPEVRELLGETGLHSHQAAMKGLIQGIREKTGENERTILVSHSFVTGGEESESERPLSVGGIQTIDASLFSWAHYTALGHLHKRQSPGNSSIHYSGSLYKYSFSEEKHEKVVLVVEMDEKGATTVTPVPLLPKRDVRCIEGYFSDIVASSPSNMPGAQPDVNDYLMVTLLDQGVILDVMNRLREVYPNVLHIRKPYLESRGAAGKTDTAQRKLGPGELFRDFVADVTGEEIPGDQLKEFEQVMNKLKSGERSQ
jgi:DNA repair protein SbcD/Mre11